MKRPTDLVWDFFTSLKLTIVCLVALMVLVVACTLAQVSLGTWGAVEVYMRSWLVWWHPTGSGFGIPVMPGGALVGLVLLTNLIAAQVRRLQRTWSKAGIWIAHGGLVLLVMGEFVTAVAQRDTRLAVHNGETVNFVESPREMELALVDTTDPATDEVYSIAAVTLARRDTIPVPGTPVTLKIRAYHKNAVLGMRKPGDPPGLATAGMGPDIVFSPVPPVSRDEEIDRSVALVEPVVGGQSMGTFLVSNALGQPQAFQAGGRTYELQMRPWREYLPYALTLREFRHDVYMGTQIPKNFSSQVRITNPARNESRDVLIYMNQPLRYEGKTFYQSSFGENDTLSILQVVENPGWLIPYVSCVLVALGLLVHFWITFRRSMARREKAMAEAAAAGGRAATTEAV